MLASPPPRPTTANESLTLETQRSGIEDADTTKVLLDLKTQELAYQTTLQVTAQSIQPTLMSFLAMIANTLSRAGRLVFTAPPPGLSPVVDFELDEVEGAFGLYAMRDTVGADLRLFLLDPAFFVPEYQPELTEEHLAPLGAEDPRQVDVYVVATLSDGAPVVNLLAPILGASRDARGHAGHPGRRGLAPPGELVSPEG